MTYVSLLKRVLASRGVLVLPANGNSMYPTLCTGDDLEILSVERADLRPGRVIAFCRGDRHVVIHRLLSIYGDDVVTAGDNSLLIDPPTPLENVLGMVLRGTRQGQSFAVKECVPFPVSDQLDRIEPEVELVGLATPGSMAKPMGVLWLGPHELQQQMRARKRSGVPILAVCDTGRGSYGTLIHYVNTYERIALVFSVLEGYANHTICQVDDGLIDEAVPTSDVCALLQAINHPIKCL